jgi:hypothetical protein
VQFPPKACIIVSMDYTEVPQPAVLAGTRRATSIGRGPLFIVLPVVRVLEAGKG